MNICTIIGRAVSAPEVKQTQGGVAVTSFNVAVGRRFDREKTDFIPVVAWRALAENCGKYITKGQRVAVSGELQTREYMDRNGNRRTAFEINADNVEFLDRPKGAGDTDAFAAEMGAELIDDEHLPF